MFSNQNDPKILTMFQVRLVEGARPFVEGGAIAGAILRTNNLKGKRRRLGGTLTPHLVCPGLCFPPDLERKITIALRIVVYGP